VMTVSSVLIVVALILTVLHGIDGRVPLWIAVFLLGVAVLVGSVVRA
jgi:hypothetical protein